MRTGDVAELIRSTEEIVAELSTYVGDGEIDRLDSIRIEIA